jgi:hypothetical protein
MRYKLGMGRGWDPDFHSRAAAAGKALTGSATRSVLNFG